MFTFPTAADNLFAAYGLVGDFWTRYYGGRELVINYLQGSALNQKQLDQNVVELQASVSRHTCPLFHTAQWYSVTLLQSQVALAAPPSTNATLPWPTDVKQVGLAVDQITTPNVTLTVDVDYTIDTTTGEITFLSNPFLNPAFKPQVVLVNGDPTDLSITLFFMNAQVDWDFFHRQFGYITGLDLPDSQNYKDYTNAILDAVAGGTSYLDIANALAALTDVPCCLSDGETVETITSDAHGQLIFTDKNVYRYTFIATPIVTVGQVLLAGDQLVDAVYIFEPNAGGVPDMTSLTIDSQLLEPSIAGPLTFNNSNTPMIVIPNVSLYTEVRWALGGVGTDVDQLFARLHAKGIAANQTLAMLMDTRPQPQASQPTAANLPSTINPMVFLCNNVLRNNAFIVRLKPADFGPNALGLVHIDLMRQIIPPHNMMLVNTV